MSDPPRIVSITLAHDEGETVWSVGDAAQINHPGHKDHERVGQVVAFQIFSTYPSQEDDQGVIIPVIDLGRRKPAIVYPVPFERLTKIEESCPHINTFYVRYEDLGWNSGPYKVCQDCGWSEAVEEGLVCGECASWHRVDDPS